jgi:hypothetical protein
LTACRATLRIRFNGNTPSRLHFASLQLDHWRKRKCANLAVAREPTPPTESWLEQPTIYIPCKELHMRDVACKPLKHWLGPLAWSRPIAAACSVISLEFRTPTELSDCGQCNTLSDLKPGLKSDIWIVEHLGTFVLVRLAPIKMLKLCVYLDCSKHSSAGLNSESEFLSWLSLNSWR